jgi:glycosyltransferase involved in cell wall biosynthesis
MRIAVVIPAYNEAAALPKVLSELPRNLAQRIVVSDNGSDDGTPDVARAHGAEVVRETRRGYGWACWAGVCAVLHDCDAIAMLDAGGKEDASELPLVLGPILRGEADFVLGSRVRYAAPGALTPQQRFGNWLTTHIMARLYGTRITDLAPFRAIRSPILQTLNMQERTFGWPTEMIVKAARAGARIAEVDVHYRPRYAGKSKVSGTLKGSVKAGIVILRTAFKYARWQPRNEPPQAGA